MGYCLQCGHKAERKIPATDNIPRLVCPNCGYIHYENPKVITVRCGQNAADVFQAADIKIYKSESTSAQDNIAALKDGKLAELTHFHAGYHGIG